MLTNVIKYAHEEIEGQWVELRLFASSESVRLEFRDQGAPFNPLDVPVPDFGTRPAERKIGGLGVHLVKSLVDDARNVPQVDPPRRCRSESRRRRS